MENCEVSDKNTLETRLLEERFDKEKNDIICGFLKEKEIIEVMHTEEMTELAMKFEQEKDFMRRQFELEMKNLLQGFQTEQVEKESEQVLCETNEWNEKSTKKMACEERDLGTQYKKERMKLRLEFEEIIAAKNEEIKILRRKLLSEGNEENVLSRISPDNDVYIKKTEHEEELRRFAETFETEKLELQRKCDREKADLVQVFANQTEQMNAKFDEQKKKIHEDLQKELQFKLEVTERLLSEKSDIDKKRVLEQFEHKVRDLQESIEKDYNDRLLDQQETIDNLEKEKIDLANALQTERFSLARLYNREMYLLTKTDQLTQTKEDLEVALLDEIAKLKQQYEDAMNEMNKRHKQQIEEVKKKQKPARELEHKHGKEMEKLKKDFLNEKEYMEAEFRKEQLNLLKSFEFEKNDMEQKYEGIIQEREAEIEQREEDLQRVYEEEVGELKTIVAKQREELDISKEKLTDLADQMEEFVSERNRLEERIAKEKNQCQTLEKIVEKNLKVFENKMKVAEEIYQKELSLKDVDLSTEKRKTLQLEAEKMNLHKAIETLNATLEEVQKPPVIASVNAMENSIVGAMVEMENGDSEIDEPLQGRAKTANEQEKKQESGASDHMDNDEYNQTEKSDLLQMGKREEEYIQGIQTRKDVVSENLLELREKLEKCIPNGEELTTVEDYQLSNKNMKEAINRAIIAIDNICSNEGKDKNVLPEEEPMFSIDDQLEAVENILKESDASGNIDKTTKDQINHKMKEVLKKAHKVAQLEKLMLKKQEEEEISALLKELADEKGKKLEEMLKDLQESKKAAPKPISEEKGKLDRDREEVSKGRRKKDPSTSDVVGGLEQENQDLKRAIEELRNTFQREKEDLIEKLQTQHKEFVMSSESEIIENVLKQKSSLEEAFNLERFCLSRLYYSEMKEELDDILDRRQENMKRKLEREKMDIIFKYESDITDLHKLLSEKDEMELRLLQDRNNVIQKLLVSQKRDTHEKWRRERKKEKDQFEREKQNLEVTIPLRKEIAELQNKRRIEHESYVANLKEAIDLMKEIISTTPPRKSEDNRQLDRASFYSEDSERSFAHSPVHRREEILESDEEIRSKEQLQVALEKLVDMILNTDVEAVYDSETTSGASSDLESEYSDATVASGETDEGAFSGPESNDGEMLSIQKEKLDFVFNIERFNLGRVYYGEYRDSLRKAMKKLAKAKETIRSLRKDLENDFLRWLRSLVRRTNFGEEHHRISTRDVDTQTTPKDSPNPVRGEVVDVVKEGQKVIDTDIDLATEQQLDDNFSRDLKTHEKEETCSPDEERNDSRDASLVRKALTSDHSLENEKCIGARTQIGNLSQGENEDAYSYFADQDDEGFIQMHGEGDKDDKQDEISNKREEESAYGRFDSVADEPQGPSNNGNWADLHKEESKEEEQSEKTGDEDIQLADELEVYVSFETNDNGEGKEDGSVKDVNDDQRTIEQVETENTDVIKLNKTDAINAVGEKSQERSSKEINSEEKCSRNDICEKNNDENYANETREEKFTAEGISQGIQTEDEAIFKKDERSTDNKETCEDSSGRDAKTPQAEDKIADVLQSQREPDKEDKTFKKETVTIDNGGKDTRGMTTEEVDHKETSEEPHGNIIYSLEHRSLGGSSQNTNERNEPLEYKSEPEEVNKILPEQKSLKESNDDEPSSKKNKLETNMEQYGNGDESLEETADLCPTKKPLGKSEYQNEKHMGENSSKQDATIDDLENFKEENLDETESIGHKDDEITSEVKPQTQLGEKETTGKDELITHCNKNNTGTGGLDGIEGSGFNEKLQAGSTLEQKSKEDQTNDDREELEEHDITTDSGERCSNENFIVQAGVVAHEEETHADEVSSKHEPEKNWNTDQTTLGNDDLAYESHIEGTIQNRSQEFETLGCLDKPQTKECSFEHKPQRSSSDKYEVTINSKGTIEGDVLSENEESRTPEPHKGQNTQLRASANDGVPVDSGENTEEGTFVEMERTGHNGEPEKDKSNVSQPRNPRNPDEYEEPLANERKDIQDKEREEFLESDCNSLKVKVSDQISFGDKGDQVTERQIKDDEAEWCSDYKDQIKDSKDYPEAEWSSDYKDKIKDSENYPNIEESSDYKDKIKDNKSYPEAERSSDCKDQTTDSKDYPEIERSFDCKDQDSKDYPEAERSLDYKRNLTPETPMFNKAIGKGSKARDVAKSEQETSFDQPSDSNNNFESSTDSKMYDYNTMDSGKDDDKSNDRNPNAGYDNETNDGPESETDSNLFRGDEDDEERFTQNELTPNEQDIINQLKRNNMVLQDKFDLLCKIVGKGFVNEIPELSKKREIRDSKSVLENVNELYEEKEFLSKEREQIDLKISRLHNSRVEEIQSYSDGKEAEAQILDSLEQIDMELRKSNEEDLVNHLKKEKKDVCTKLGEIDHLLQEKMGGVRTLAENDADSRLGALMSKRDRLKDDALDKSRELQRKSKMLEEANRKSKNEDEQLLNSLNELKALFDALEDSRAIDSYKYRAKKIIKILPPDIESLIGNKMGIDLKKMKLDKKLKKIANDIERYDRLLDEKRKSLQPFQRKKDRLEQGLHLLDPSLTTGSKMLAGHEQNTDKVSQSIASMSFGDDQMQREGNSTSQEHGAIEKEMKALNLAISKMPGELKEKLCEETTTAKRLEILHKETAQIMEQLKNRNAKIGSEESLLRKAGVEFPSKITEHLEKALDMEKGKLDNAQLIKDGSLSDATTHESNKLESLLLLKKSLVESTGGLEDEISREQENFLLVRQFKKTGEIREETDCKIKVLIDTQKNLLTELNDTNKMILQRISIGGLTGSHAELIEDSVAKKMRLEREIDKMQDEIDGEPVRAAEALASLAEKKLPLDEDLAETLENIKLQAQRIQEAFTNDDQTNTIPEKIALLINQALQIKQKGSISVKGLRQRHQEVELVLKQNAERLVEAKETGKDTSDEEEVLENSIREKMIVDGQLKEVLREMSSDSEVLSSPQDEAGEQTMQNTGKSLSEPIALIEDICIEAEGSPQNLKDGVREVNGNIYANDSCTRNLLMDVGFSDEEASAKMEELRSLVIEKSKLKDELQQLKLFEELLNEGKTFERKITQYVPQGENGKRKEQNEIELAKINAIIERKINQLQELQRRKTSKGETLKQLQDAREELDNVLETLDGDICKTQKEVKDDFEKLQRILDEQRKLSGEEQEALGREIDSIQDELERCSKEERGLEKELHFLKKEYHEESDLEKLFIEKECLREYLAEIDTAIGNSDTDVVEQEKRQGDPLKYDQLKESKKALEKKLDDIRDHKGKIIVEYEEEEIEETIKELTQRKHDLQEREEEISEEIRDSGVLSELTVQAKELKNEIPLYAIQGILFEMARDKKTLTEFIKEQQDLRNAVQKQRDELGDTIALVKCKVGEKLFNIMTKSTLDDDEVTTTDQYLSILSEVTGNHASIDEALHYLAEENEQLMAVNETMNLELEVLKEKVGEQLATELLNTELPKEELEFGEVVTLTMKEDGMPLATILQEQKSKIQTMEDTLGKGLFDCIAMSKGITEPGTEGSNSPHPRLVAPGIMERFDEDLESVIAIYEKNLNNLLRENKVYKNLLGEDLAQQLLRVSNSNEKLATPGERIQHLRSGQEDRNDTHDAADENIDVAINVTMDAKSKVFERENHAVPSTEEQRPNDVEVEFTEELLQRETLKEIAPTLFNLYVSHVGFPQEKNSYALCEEDEAVKSSLKAVDAIWRNGETLGEIVANYERELQQAQQNNTITSNPSEGRNNKLESIIDDGSKITEVSEMETHMQGVIDQENTLEMLKRRLGEDLADMLIKGTKQEFSQEFPSACHISIEEDQVGNNEITNHLEQDPLALNDDKKSKTEIKGERLSSSEIELLSPKQNTNAVAEDKKGLDGDERVDDEANSRKLKAPRIALQNNQTLADVISSYELSLEFLQNQLGPYLTRTLLEQRTYAIPYHDGKKQQPPLKYREGNSEDKDSSEGDKISMNESEKEQNDGKTAVAFSVESFGNLLTEIHSPKRKEVKAPSVMLKSRKTLEEVIEDYERQIYVNLSKLEKEVSLLKEKLGSDLLGILLEEDRTENYIPQGDQNASKSQGTGSDYELEFNIKVRSLIEDEGKTVEDIIRKYDFQLQEMTRLVPSETIEGTSILDLTSDLEDKISSLRNKNKHLEEEKGVLEEKLNNIEKLLGQGLFCLLDNIEDKRDLSSDVEINLTTADKMKIEDGTTTKSQLGEDALDSDHIKARSLIEGGRTVEDILHKYETKLEEMAQLLPINEGKGDSTRDVTPSSEDKGPSVKTENKDSQGEKEIMETKLRNLEKLIGKDLFCLLGSLQVRGDPPSEEVDLKAADIVKIKDGETTKSQPDRGKEEGDDTAQPDYLISLIQNDGKTLEDILQKYERELEDMKKFIPSEKGDGVAVIDLISDLENTISCIKSRKKDVEVHNEIVETKLRSLGKLLGQGLLRVLENLQARGELSGDVEINMSVTDEIYETKQEEEEGKEADFLRATLLMKDGQTVEDILKKYERQLEEMTEFLPNETVSGDSKEVLTSELEHETWRLRGEDMDFKKENEIFEEKLRNIEKHLGKGLFCLLDNLHIRSSDEEADFNEADKTKFDKGALLESQLGDDEEEDTAQPCNLKARSMIENDGKTMEEILLTYETQLEEMAKLLPSEKSNGVSVMDLISDFENKMAKLESKNKNLEEENKTLEERLRNVGNFIDQDRFLALDNVQPDEGKSPNEMNTDCDISSKTNKEEAETRSEPTAHVGEDEIQPHDRNEITLTKNGDQTVEKSLLTSEKQLKDPAKLFSEDASPMALMSDFEDGKLSLIGRVNDTEEETQILKEKLKNLEIIIGHDLLHALDKLPDLGSSSELETSFDAVRKLKHGHITLEEVIKDYESELTALWKLMPKPGKESRSLSDVIKDFEENNDQLLRENKDLKKFRDELTDKIGSNLFSDLTRFLRSHDHGLETDSAIERKTSQKLWAPKRMEEETLTLEEVIISYEKDLNESKRVLEVLNGVSERQVETPLQAAEKERSLSREGFHRRHSFPSVEVDKETPVFGTKWRKHDDNGRIQEVQTDIADATEGNSHPFDRDLEILKSRVGHGLAEEIMRMKYIISASTENKPGTELKITKIMEVKQSTLEDVLETYESALGTLLSDTPASADDVDPRNIGNYDGSSVVDVKRENEILEKRIGVKLSRNLLKSEDCGIDTDDLALGYREEEFKENEKDATATNDPLTNTGKTDFQISSEELRAEVMVGEEGRTVENILNKWSRFEAIKEIANDEKILSKVLTEYEEDVENMRKEIAVLQDLASKDSETSCVMERIEKYENEISSLNDKVRSQGILQSKVGALLSKQLIALSKSIDEESRGFVSLRALEAMEKDEDLTLADIVKNYEDELDRKSHEILNLKELISGDMLEIATSQESEICELKNVNLILANEMEYLTDKIGQELSDELLKKSAKDPLTDNVKLYREVVNRMYIDGKKLQSVLEDLGNERTLMQGKIEELTRSGKMVEELSRKIGEDLFKELHEEAPKTTKLADKPMFEISNLMSVEQKTLGEVILSYEKDLARLRRENEAFCALMEKESMEDTPVIDVLSDYEEKISKLESEIADQYKTTQTLNQRIGAELSQELFKLPNEPYASSNKGASELKALEIIQKDKSSLLDVLINYEKKLKERDDDGESVDGSTVPETIGIDVLHFEGFVLEKLEALPHPEESLLFPQPNQIIEENIVQVQLPKHEESFNTDFVENLFAFDRHANDEKADLKRPSALEMKPKLEEEKCMESENLQKKIKQLEEELEEEKSLKEKYEKDAQDLLKDIVVLKMKQIEDGDENPEESRRIMQEEIEIKQDNRRLEEDLRIERKRRLSAEESKRDLINEVDTLMKQKEALLQRQKETDQTEKFVEDMISVRRKIGEQNSINKKLKEQVMELEKSMKEREAFHNEEKSQLLANHEKEKSQLMQELVASKETLETQLKELFAMNEDLKGTIKILLDQLKESNETLGTEVEDKTEKDNAMPHGNSIEQDIANLFEEAQEKKRFTERENTEHLKEQHDETDYAVKESSKKYKDQLESLHAQKAKRETELQQQVDILTRQLEMEREFAREQSKEFENLQGEKKHLKENMDLKLQKHQCDFEETKAELSRRQDAKSSVHLLNPEEGRNKESEEVLELLQIERAKIQEAFDQELRRIIFEKEEEQRLKDEQMNRELLMEKRELKAIIEREIYDQLIDKNLETEADFRELLSRILQEHSKEIEGVENDIQKAEERFKDEKNRLIEQSDKEKNALKEFYEEEKKALQTTVQDLLKEVIKLKNQRKELRLSHKKEIENMEAIYEKDILKLKENREEYKRDLLNKLKQDFDTKLVNETSKQEIQIQELQRELNASEQRRKEVEELLKQTPAVNFQQNIDEEASSSKGSEDRINNLKDLTSVKQKMEEEYDTKLSKEKRKFEETLQGLRHEIGNLQEKRRVIQEKLYGQDPTSMDKHLMEKSLTNYKMEMLSKMEQEVEQKVAREKEPLEEAMNEMQREVDDLKQQRWELRNQMRRERAKMEEEFEMERENIQRQFLKEKEDLKSKLDSRVQKELAKRAAENKISRALSPIYSVSRKFDV